MRFAKHYIIKVLKEGESGVPVTDLYRLYGFSISSFYKRKAKYGSLAPSSIKHLEELEEETRKYEANVYLIKPGALSAQRYYRIKMQLQVINIGPGVFSYDQTSNFFQ